VHFQGTHEKCRTTKGAKKSSAIFSRLILIGTIIDLEWFTLSPEETKKVTDMAFRYKSRLVYMAIIIGVSPAYCTVGKIHTTSLR